MGNKVTISVHERLDADGYIVRITSGKDVTKLPTDTFEEAEALARSVKNYADLGLPLDVFFSDESEDVEEVAP